MFHNHPTIDLTAAAQAYGLEHIPPIVWQSPDDMMGSPAGYSHSDDALYVSEMLFSPMIIDDYDQARFARQGVGPLDADDAARFIVAHELFHAREYEIWPLDVMVMQGLAINRGLLDHDAAPIEVAADQAAATAYKLIGIER